MKKHIALALLFSLVVPAHVFAMDSGEGEGKDKGTEVDKDKGQKAPGADDKGGKGAQPTTSCCARTKAWVKGHKLATVGIVGAATLAIAAVAGTITAWRLGYICKDENKEKAA